MLNDISSNQRGGILQKFISDEGELKVIGGSDIDKYKIRSIKGKISKIHIDKDQYCVKSNSLLVQNIIAHIDNPKPHLQIIACIPKGDYILVDTINQIQLQDNFSSSYIWCLLNSMLINWYAYGFIFAKAIRTMHFDNSTTSKIPIPKISPEQQEPFVQKAEQMLKLHQELHTQTQSVLDYLNIKFDNSSKLSQKLQTFYNLTPNDFLTEISKLHKQKQANERKKVAGKLPSSSLKTSNKLSKADEQDWLEYFSQKQSPLQNLQTQIQQTDHEIDQMVYKLYNLTPQEIKIVETS